MLFNSLPAVGKGDLAQILELEGKSVAFLNQFG